MEFEKPAVSCPIYCNRLLVCDTLWCGSRAGFGKRFVRALQRADCPHALACGICGLPARLGSRLARSPCASTYPASCCNQVAPALRSGGAHLPLPQRPLSDAAWDCGLQRPQWLWWPAAVACAAQHSFTVIGTDSRDGSYGRFLTVLSIYVGPDASRLSLEGIQKNDEWEN
jgi:hypothetical protein